jgi:hypothetical protein
MSMTVSFSRHVEVLGKWDNMVDMSAGALVGGIAAEQGKSEIARPYQKSRILKIFHARNAT